MAEPKIAEELLDEVRLLFHVGTEAAERLHAEESVGASLRAVLEHLTHHAPTTVPAIARSRRVSRQHIQVLVNELLELGLVRLEDNPAHARSHLRARERVVLGNATARIGSGRMRQAIRTLRDLRTALQPSSNPKEQRTR